MKKETGVLTRRQEALMNFLWEIDTPLTANEMAGKLKDEGWSAVTLFKTVQALDAEGYLMVTGIVSTGKHMQGRWLLQCLRLSIMVLFLKREILKLRISRKLFPLSLEKVRTMKRKN